MNEFNLPKHIAIVMDGNGRWAKARNLPRIAGHKAGAKVIEKIVAYCVEKSIQTLTLWAFSTENWGRPKAEVDYLLRLFLNSIKNVGAELNKNNIRFLVIGDKTKLGPALQKAISAAENATLKNTGLKLIIAFNYGGKWDIVNAIKNIAQKVKENKLTVENIDIDTVADNLATAGILDPDLFIRTSGELRLSNFLLWQLAYTELYFSDSFWPDFTVLELEKILKDYAKRQRRYGLV